MASDYDHRLIVEAADTYTDAVYAVLAFVNQFRYDDDAKRMRSDVEYGLGRRMQTSTENRVSKNTVVTPDCVVQSAGRQGVVAEAKLSLPQDVDAWDGSFRQLVKYDDVLKGWWTADELIDSHDVVALVPLSRAVKFADRLNEQISAGTLRFERKISVVGFFKTTRAKTFIALKKETGEVSDSTISQRLRNVVEVPWDAILLNYGDRKFLDSEPPPEYMLQVVWDYILTAMASERPNDAGKNYVSVPVDVRDITQRLQQYFGFPSSGARSVEIPKLSWVRKAFETMVECDLCLRTPGNRDAYVVHYRRPRKDTLKFFGERVAKLRKRKKSAIPPADAPTLPLTDPSQDPEAV